jgi:hypothetical protein
MQKPNPDKYVWAGIATAVLLGSIGVAEPATSPISLVIFAGLYAHWRWRKNRYDHYLARQERAGLPEE